MKKLLASAAALALTTGAVQAADLYTPPPVEAVVYEPAFSWTGFYLGLHGGWGWADGSANYVNTDDLPPFFDDECGIDSNWGCALSLDPEGAYVGGQIGFNWQWGQFVLGIEGDYSFASLNDNGEGFFNGGDDFSHVDLEVKSLAGVQGRFGWAFGQWLPFATVGWGWAEAERQVTNSDIGLNTSDSQWHDGLTLGAGLEYAITNNWTVKGEYRWYNLSEETYGVGFADGTDVDLDIHTVRFGVNYKF